MVAPSTCHRPGRCAVLRLLLGAVLRTPGGSIQHRGSRRTVLSPLKCLERGSPSPSKAPQSDVDTQREVLETGS